MGINYKKISNVFKAFCDEKRIQILEMLQDGEKCACELQEQLEIAQSALSYHMKILVNSGVVQSRQEGKWTHYTISQDGREDAMKLLKEITSTNITHSTGREA